MNRSRRKQLAADASRYKNVIVAHCGRRRVFRVLSSSRGMESGELEACNAVNEQLVRVTYGGMVEMENGVATPLSWR